jgi:hypothetical protein
LQTLRIGAAATGSGEKDIQSPAQGYFPCPNRSGIRTFETFEAEACQEGGRGLKDLRAGVTGRFSEDVRQTLEADPGLVNRLARSVLEAHFPPSLQSDIADAVGLDLAEPAPSVPATAKKKARDAAFRDSVLMA